MTSIFGRSSPKKSIEESLGIHVQPIPKSIDDYRETIVILWCIQHTRARDDNVQVQFGPLLNYGYKAIDDSIHPILNTHGPYYRAFITG